METGEAAAVEEEMTEEAAAEAAADALAADFPAVEKEKEQIRQKDRTAEETSTRAVLPIDQEEILSEDSLEEDSKN